MRSPSDGWDRGEREALEDLQQEIDALRARHADVPPLDLLRAARHDALPADLQAAAERHLSGDPWKRVLVEGLHGDAPPLTKDREDLLLAQIRSRLPDVPQPWLRPWRGAALALAAAAALVVTAWVIRPDPQATPPSSSAGSSEQTPPVPTPAAPRWEAALEKPTVTLSLAALTWRGAGKDNELLRDLKAPLDAFRQGEYGLADREFTRLEPRHPGAVEVFFYGGVARLFVEEPRRALPALRRAGELADSTFAPRVAWYRAIAEQRLGDSAAARSQLEMLCLGDTEYGARACRAIAQMAAAGGPDAR